ncbi:MAG: hypothetical protein AAFR58_24225 [Cyanobacteria bacterium J06627_28]
MTVSRKTAKKLIYDFMFESADAKEWVEDVWGLSPFLGQGAANAAEVMGVLLETCSERQLNAVVSSLYAAHQETIQDLASASEWRVSIDAKTAATEAKDLN